MAKAKKLIKCDLTKKKCKYAKMEDHGVLDMIAVSIVIEVRKTVTGSNPVHP